VAQAVLIKAETVRDGVQYIGDVIGIVDDSHIFTPDEIAKFNILTVNGSVEDVRAKFAEVTPTIYPAFLWSVDGEYHWDEDFVNPCTQVESLMSYSI